MVALPTVGGSQNVWGDELNEFLSVEHNSDGTHNITTGVNASDYNANTILKADTDDTPEALTIGEQTFVGRITGGEITALTPAQGRTLFDVPTNADVVLDSLFDANTILKADTDNTPAALTVGTNSVVGRTTGNITTIPTTTVGAADSLVKTNADADITLSDAVISSASVKGGVFRNVSQLLFAQTYTQTADWSTTDGGQMIFVDWYPTLNYANPSVQSGDVLGPGGVFQLQGTTTYQVDGGSYYMAPIGFSDQLVVKNNQGSNRILTPSWQFMSNRWWVADAATCTAVKTDSPPFGPVAFVDNQVVATCDTGTWNMTAAGDYTLASFVSFPWVAGNTTLSRRVGFWAYDVATGNPTATAIWNIAGIASKVGTTAFDNVVGTVTNNYGVYVSRLLNGTNNYAARLDAAVELWGDTITFTANPVPNVMARTNGTHTLSSAADSIASMILDSRTTIVDTTLNAFATGITFYDTSTTKSGANTTNRDLKSHWSFYATPIVTADQSDDTLSSLIGFRATPRASVTGAGTPTLAITNAVGFHAAGATMDTSVTATTVTGLLIDEATGAGTVTNQYGIDIATLTKGATKNRGIRLGAGCRGIEFAQTSTHDTTTLLPASSGSIYFKGNNFVIAYNDAGTMRFTYTIMTGITTPGVWTHNTTGP